MPLFTGDRNLNEIQTQLALFAPSGGLGIPTSTYGLFTGRPAEDFIVASQAGSGIATVTANNLDIDIQTLGFDESNGPNTITPPIGVIDFRNTNIHFINNTPDIGGSNRQSLLFDNVKLECSVYSAGGSRVSETGVQLGNWHDRGDGGSITTRLPLYTFNDVELRGDNGQTGAIPAGQGGVERANLTLRMTAIRDGSTFGDLSLWNGRGIADTYIDTSPSAETGAGQRSNVRGGLFIGATNTHYNKITVGPIGINQVTATDISTEVPQDNMVLGFSNEGNVEGFDTNGQYSASNHFAIVNELDLRALNAGLVDQNAVRYTIGLDGYSNTFFLNPLLGGVITTQTPTGPILTVTAPTGLNLGSGFTLEDNSTGTDLPIIDVKLANGSAGSPLPNVGTWYFVNGDEVSNPNQSPLRDEPLIKSDGLEILVFAQNLVQIHRDIILGANAAQRMPRSVDHRSFIFTSEGTADIGIFRLDGIDTTRTEFVIRAQADAGLLGEIDGDGTGSFDTNIAAWTGYNGDTRSRTLIATAPVFDDIDDSIGLHVITQSGDRTRDFYEINSSNWNDFNNEPIPITDRKSTVFSAQSSISAIAVTSHEYDAPQESLPPEIINNGRLANYVSIQPLIDLEFRKYSWAQQPTSSEFGRLKTVSAPAFDSTDTEVLEARNNGFSLRQPNGLFEFTHDIDDSTDPLTTKLGNFEEFEARVKLKQSLVDIVNRIGGGGEGIVDQVAGNTIRWSYGEPLTSLANFGGVRILPSGTVINANAPGATFTFTVTEPNRESGTLVFTSGVPVELQGPGDTFEFVSIAEANRPAGPLTGVDLLGLFKANQIDAAYRDNEITETHYALPYTLIDTVLDLGAANINFIFEDADDTILATFENNTWTIPTTALRLDDNNEIDTIKTSGNIDIDARIPTELKLEDTRALDQLRISNINQDTDVYYSVYNTVTDLTISSGFIGAGGEVILTVLPENQNNQLRVGVAGQKYFDFLTEDDNNGLPIVQAGTEQITVAPLMNVNDAVSVLGIPTSGALLTPQRLATIDPTRIILAADPNLLWDAIETVTGLSYVKSQNDLYVELITRINNAGLIQATSLSSIEVDNEYFVFSQEDGSVLAGGVPDETAARMAEVFNNAANRDIPQAGSNRTYYPDDNGKGNDYRFGYLSFTLENPDGVDLDGVTVGTRISSGTALTSTADPIQVGNWFGTVRFSDVVGSTWDLEIAFNDIESRDFVANTLESVSHWRLRVGEIEGVFSATGKVTFKLDTANTVGVDDISNALVGLNTYNPQDTSITLANPQYNRYIVQDPWTSEPGTLPPENLAVNRVGSTSGIDLNTDLLWRTAIINQEITEGQFTFDLGLGSITVHPVSTVAFKNVDGISVPRYKGRVDLFTLFGSESVLLGCPVYVTNVVSPKSLVDHPFSRISTVVIGVQDVSFQVENRFVTAGASETFITEVESNLEAAIIAARNVVIGTR